MIDDFKKYCIEQHDVVCNQKYGDTLPYSFHLDMVARQAEKWKHLLKTLIEKDVTHMGAWGHDLIEDTRLTYNNVVQISGERVADIIYCCTDSLGKTRDERHDDEFWKRLQSNDLAIFVKLCDVIANVLYSILTTSTMLKRYKKEFSKLKEKIYREQYKEMFDYLEELLTL